MVLLAACTTQLGVVEESDLVASTTLATTTSTMPTTTTTVPKFHVRGTVTRPDGRPVIGATVSMGEESVVTDQLGAFTFETPSPQDMTVFKNGWSSDEIVYQPDLDLHRGVIDLHTVRGLRVSADTAADPARFQTLLDIASATAVNTLVFDTKQEGGKVLYDTGIEDAHQIGAVEPLYDPGTVLSAAKAEGLYTITRIVTFEDAIRAAARPEERIAGPWLDPSSSSAREYAISLGEEACALGFDEVQFDYVRFPSGQAAAVSGQLEMTQDERVSVITGFLEEASERIRPLGCPVSAAIFGIVASTPDDQGLGQRPDEISTVADAVSPMVYPSHYSPGWLGFADPNDYPYEVTADAITDALVRMDDRSRLRPYLQAFWWSNAQIREAIQAAEDNSVGWILWNVRSNFDIDALPSDSEIGS